MSAATAQIERARATVLGVLRRELTPETHPGMFDDDALYLAARALERDDTAWLDRCCLRFRPSGPRRVSRAPSLRRALPHLLPAEDRKH
jgi:hypothetical protein